MNTRRIVLLTVPCVLAVSAVVVSVQMASADFVSVHATDGTVQTLVFGEPESHLLPLAADGFAPGMTVVQRYELRRGAGPTSGSFTVRTYDVEDYERSCNRPEQHDGDETCGDGAGQGELSQHLLIGHAWSDADGGCADAPLPIEGIPLSEADGATDAAAEPDSGVECLVLTLELPLSTGDVVQTDQTTFSLRLGLLDPS